MRLDSGDFLADLKRWTKAFLAVYEANASSPETIANYSRVLGNFYEFAINNGEHMAISDINLRYLHEFIKWRKKTFSKNNGTEISLFTLSNDIKVIKAFIRHISEYNEDSVDLITKLSKLGVKLPDAEKDHFTPQETEKLIAYLDNLTQGGKYETLRNSLAIKLMLCAGFRASEVLKVKLGDFQEIDDDELIEVRIEGKGRKVRFIPIRREEVEAEVEFFQKEYNADPEALLMVKKTGKVIVRTELNNIINRIYKKAGINRTGLHILRHTYANNLLEAGADILDVKNLLRHARIQTTMVYSRPSWERARASVKNLKRKEEGGRKNGGKEVSAHETEKIVR
jgi:integrase/recombinase XerD